MFICKNEVGIRVQRFCSCSTVIHFYTFSLTAEIRKFTSYRHQVCERKMEYDNVNATLSMFTTFSVFKISIIIIFINLVY